MCSWCGALVSSKSCREKKSMSFSITKNASPENKARKAMGSDNSCNLVGLASRAGIGAINSTFLDGPR